MVDSKEIMVSNHNAETQIDSILDAFGKHAYNEPHQDYIFMMVDQDEGSREYND